MKPPLNTSDVELRPGFELRPQISHVVFDFDGTLSWLRHGWPQMMTHLFLEHLPLLPGEQEDAVRGVLLEELLSLNGKPTIFQMARFVERLLARQAAAPDPEELRQEYQRRLDRHIAQRRQWLESGAGDGDSFLVHGARPLLEGLRRRGLTLVILSGTPEAHVRKEAALLKIDDFFGDHIYGPRGDVMRFSKREVMEQLLSGESIQGRQLLAFGDGPVEIQHARELGGLSVAVCSDEAQNGSGRVDPVKRRTLLAAGAAVVIADYREPARLLEVLLGS